MNQFREWLQKPLNAAILAIIAAIAAGGYMLYFKSQRLDTVTQAVAKAAKVAKDIGPLVQKFENEQHRLPVDNSEINLAKVVDASWAPLTAVQVRGDGSIYFQYTDPGVTMGPDPVMLWRLRDTNRGKAGSCSAQRVMPEALDANNLKCDQQEVSMLRPRINGQVQLGADGQPVLEHLSVGRQTAQTDSALSAIDQNDDAALQKLKDSGAKICEPSPEGRLPLAEAARGNQMKALAVLIAVPCDLQQVEPFSQMTALMAASSLRAADSVQALIAAGADPNFTPPGKSSPWSLLGDGEDDPTMKTREILRGGNADINVAREDGTTSLIRAADSGSTMLTQWLIDRGANLNLQDKKGWTAVMHAALSPKGTPALKLLIKAKADLNVRDAQAQTALGRVLAMPDQQRQAEVKALLTQAGGHG